MRAFAALYAELDASTATTAKVDALVRYFNTAVPRDAAWAVYFLAGGKPRAVVGSRALREFAVAASGLPDWLFEESYQAVGDLAETIAHLLPPPLCASELGLARWIEERLLPLRGLPPAEVLARLRAYAEELDGAGRFLLIKLIGGGFRVGVSKLLVTRALAQHAGVDAKLAAQRLIGYTDIARLPTAERYLALVAPAQADGGARPEGGTPYPFFLAHPLAVSLDEFDAVLGPPVDWIVEWKFDGIRAQLVRRDGQAWLWSRGEELITERFPEIALAAAALPDGTVVDGEVLVWDADAAHPAPFARLQTRVTRKIITPKLIAGTPASFVGYDLIEQAGVDLRALPQSERRARLEALFGAGFAGAPGAGAGGADSGSTLRLSPLVNASSWQALAALRTQSRARQVEGFMLKHRGARYGTGRTKDAGGSPGDTAGGTPANRERGDRLQAIAPAWYKWKIDPMSVDCVLVYAQRGHGRRASLYTDYTFAVWDRAPRDAAEAQQTIDAIARGEAPATLQARGLPVLVPFAKAYSGLTDEEIRQVDAVIRKTTVEKFGPVRTVVPSLVFELGFEGIQRSPRHKSGIAVRFPRMLRWRRDKPLAEADTLATLAMLLEPASAAIGAASSCASPRAG
jgi:DNA ligase-1